MNTELIKRFTDKLNSMTEEELTYLVMNAEETGLGRLIADKIDAETSPRYKYPLPSLDQECE